MTPPLTREQIATLIEWHERQIERCDNAAKRVPALDWEKDARMYRETVEGLRELAAQDETLETLRRELAEEKTAADRANADYGAAVAELHQLRGALERLRAARPADGDTRECPLCKGDGRHQQTYEASTDRWVHSANYQAASASRPTEAP